MDNHTGESTVVTNCWIGPQGTISPAHTDPFTNCFVQVVGTKWVWIAPPQTATNLEQTLKVRGNTAGVDVFAPWEGTKQWVNGAQQARLAPGDLLYLPPKWWHALKSLDRVRFFFLLSPLLPPRSLSRVAGDLDTICLLRVTLT